MARDHISKYSKGRHGIEKIFKRSYKLRKFLTPKEKKQAIQDLHKYSKRGGITARPGSPGYRSEVETVYGKWRRNTKDRINRAEARMIKRELEKYQSNIETDPRHPRTSRKYFKKHTDPFDRSKGVPQPGGDVRSGSYGYSGSLPTSPIQPPSFGENSSNDIGSTKPIDKPEPYDF
jgi:hypothetical protein